ncbi:MAG: signal peptidase I [Ruminococcus sp.]|nr:signal peptidase I [Ruminococcus sp.]
MKIDEKKLDALFEEPDAASEKTDGEVVKIKLNKSVVTSTVFDWLGSLFMALICVLILMSFFFRIIDVDGPSMEPTLINTDKVVITDLFYTPHQGDIVVISHGERYEKALIKRVIATEGQDLQIDFENNKVYVDGELQNEDYIQGVTRIGDRSAEEVNGIVPEGKVFVMGDNRTVSLDSRFNEVGLINVSDIIGKAQLDIIPHSYSSEGTPKLDLSKIRYLYK